MIILSVIALLCLLWVIVGLICYLSNPFDNYGWLIVLIVFAVILCIIEFARAITGITVCVKLLGLHDKGARERFFALATVIAAVGFVTSIGTFIVATNIRDKISKTYGKPRK